MVRPVDVVIAAHRRRWKLIGSHRSGSICLSTQTTPGCYENLSSETNSFHITNDPEVESSNPARGTSLQSWKINLLFPSLEFFGMILCFNIELIELFVTLKKLSMNYGNSRGGGVGKVNSQSFLCKT